MFSGFCLYKRSSIVSRAFHVGKEFANLSTEDIVFRAVCVNLRQRKWKVLEQMTPSFTNSLVSRVVCEFRQSPKLALEFYTWVGQSRHFSHSLESSCAIIHLLVNMRKFDEALSIMGNLMLANSVSPLEFTERLLDSYEICDATPAVFDALVRACTQIGATEGAYEVIQKLKVNGLVSIHAWNNFLSHLLKLNEIVRFWKVYKEVVSCGYVENANSFNLLIYALSCQKMGVMSGDNVLPNSVTYNCIINGFCKIGRVAVAEEILNDMIKAGVDCNVRTYATLIDGYARGGSSEESLRLCDDMVERGLVPNTVVYNSIIHWFLAEGDMEGASLLLSDMIEKHVYPDQFTYSILTKGLCRNGYVTQAFKFHNQVVEKHIIEDAFSHNILINYLCKSNNLAGAKQLLSSMIVRGLIPDISTYGALIDGYCKEGNIESAVQLYENMIKRIGLLDVITYNTLINGYCISGKIAEAFALFDEMRSAGISVDKVSYNILINYLCKFGCFQQAKELTKVMILHGVVPDFITYTTLCTNFSKNCSPEEVIELHDDMVLNGVIPDRQTYKAIISPLLGKKSAEEHGFMDLSNHH
ncbi:Pentatricopeptide repeat [Melia azedarach]|uniref:Pentatricopeptide repeat n=1 Tax=Melia azedarach TaxID=155640 RepID=A0ACC1WXU7_MELAZ|nr:Pentatricopeptide repeat [Melia azedarach]